MKYAITGGIGSGKSHVCRALARRGITVYDCDAAAKRLIASDEEVQRRLSEAAGRDLFASGSLDRAALSRFLLASEANNRRINAIVHPAVADDFRRSGLTWMESAILFEAGFERHIDRVVCVTAPLETRVSRIMRRDGITREAALAWINRQMPEAEKARRADWVIVNDGLTPIEPQIERILTKEQKALDSLAKGSQTAAD